MHVVRSGFIVLLLAFVVLAAGPARAAGLDEALAHFTQDDYSETGDGISAIAASGDARAAAIIEALQDGRLLFSAASKAVVYKDASGTLLDAATGRPVTAPADLEPVRINNRLRRAIDAALGGLTLLSPDPARRYDAAQAVFKSRDGNAIGALATAIAKETDPGIKRALEEARAAVILFQDDVSEADRLDAVSVVRARGDQEALALLSDLPSAVPVAVKLTAASAVTAIRKQLEMWAAVQNAWYGLSLGSVLAARGDRSRHHFRRHGRHQHGAWRDGDAGRLCDLRRPGADPLLQSGPVRLFARSSPFRWRSP